MTDALWGFVGAVVGAAAALIGTLLSLRHARTLQRAQSERESRERQVQLLKDAWTELFTAFQRFTAQIAEVQAVPTGRSALALSEVWRDQIPLMGTRVRLLETSVEARQKSAELLNDVTMVMVGTGLGEGDILARLASVGELHSKIATLEAWVTDVRFADGYVDRTPKPT